MLVAHGISSVYTLGQRLCIAEANSRPLKPHEPRPPAPRCEPRPSLACSDDLDPAGRCAYKLVLLSHYVSCSYSGVSVSSTGNSGSQQAGMSFAAACFCRPDPALGEAANLIIKPIGSSRVVKETNASTNNSIIRAKCALLNE